MTTDVHALAAAYSLDALDEAERAEFEAHLESCAECRVDVAEFGDTAAFLADGSWTIPPADLKARVMADVVSTFQEPVRSAEIVDLAPPAPAPAPSAVASAEAPRTATVTDLSERRRRFTPSTLLATAAAFVLFAVGAVALFGLRGGGTDLDDVLTASDVRIVSLETQVDGTPGSVQVAWSAERDEFALIANGVPQPGEGLRYALWAIADGVPIASGLFDPDGGTIRAAGSVSDVDAVAFGITIEPEAGSDVPTGDVLYLGNV